MNITFDYTAPEAVRLSSLSLAQGADGNSCLIGEQSDDPDACLDGETAVENPFI